MVGLRVKQLVKKNMIIFYIKIDQIFSFGLIAETCLIKNLQTLLLLKKMGNYSFCMTNTKVQHTL